MHRGEWPSVEALRTVDDPRRRARLIAARMAVVEAELGEMRTGVALSYRRGARAATALLAIAAAALVITGGSAAAVPTRAHRAARAIASPSTGQGARLPTRATGEAANRDDDDASRLSRGDSSSAPKPAARPAARNANTGFARPCSWRPRCGVEGRAGSATPRTPRRGRTAAQLRPVTPGSRRAAGRHQGTRAAAGEGSASAARRQRLEHLHSDARQRAEVSVSADSVQLI